MKALTQGQVEAVDGFKGALEQAIGRRLGAEEWARVKEAVLDVCIAFSDEIWRRMKAELERNESRES